MSGQDLFRKLGAGVKFDFKRFQADAEKLKIIKPRTEATPVTENVPVPPEEITVVPGKRKAPDDARSDDSESEGEVQIMAGMSGTKDQKKKKRQKLAQMAAKQRRIELRALRRAHGIHTHGTDVPAPVTSFAQLSARYGLSQRLLDNVTASGYSAPTPIQMQAMPCLLERRDVLACAPTGSGKTAAFLLPILHQLQATARGGFRAVILAPTRELAQQTFRECHRLAQSLGLHIHMLDKLAEKKFAPGSKDKFDVLVTTPYKLVYLLNADPPAISLAAVQWLVVDESDKLFEEGKTGFRDQLATIYQACDGAQVRRAMFSATFTHDVEEWCKLNLDNVLQVYIGAKNHATELIQQELMFVGGGDGSESGKLMAVRDLFLKGVSPPVLIFVQSKERANELYQELKFDKIRIDMIHSQRTQSQRDAVVREFRSGKVWVLICTDLMGRGMDFKGVNLVINYDFPNSAISYIHRIGRTGRAGRPGRAITFFTEDDRLLLRSIANVMKEAGCPVPDYMLKMPKADKGRLKKLATSAIERKTIRTFIGAEEVAKKKQKKKKFKKKTVFVSSSKPGSGQKETTNTSKEKAGTTQNGKAGATQKQKAGTTLKKKPDTTQKKKAGTTQTQKSGKPQKPTKHKSMQKNKAKSIKKRKPPTDD